MTYEYRVQSIESVDFEATLNRMGSDRWQLIHVEFTPGPPPQPHLSHYKVVMMREVPKQKKLLT